MNPWALALIYAVRQRADMLAAQREALAIERERLALEREEAEERRIRQQDVTAGQKPPSKQELETLEVAMRLVDDCRNGQWMKAIDLLYANDIVSVEAQVGENTLAQMRGIDQVRGKTEWFEKNFEVHSAKVSGPFVARDTFVVQFDLDTTEKTSGKRMPMSEVGIYTVKDGKVAREEFLPLVVTRLSSLGFQPS